MINNFQNKKVLMMGLGLLGGGTGTAKFFLKNGANLIITDKKSQNELKESVKEIKSFIKKNKISPKKIKFVFGGHPKKFLKDCDLIIKNPAVSFNSFFLKTAKQKKIPIETETTIFFKYCKSKNIIGITGTKGKSTISYLTYLFLKTKYKDVYLAGNIGISLLEEIEKIKENTKLIVELSSFQLENLKESPHISLISNIFPDHLDRYKNIKEYIKAKSSIFKYQKRGDVLILNYDNPYTSKIPLIFRRLKSDIYLYSEENKINVPYSFKKGAYIRNEKIYFGKEKKPIIDLSLIFKKEIPFTNILASITLAKILNIPSSNIKRVLKIFKGIKNRIELVKEIKGVKYFNDTTATIPDATINSLNILLRNYPQSNIILIAGGKDKCLNYKNFCDFISKKIKNLILLEGSASLKIKKELKNSKIKIFDANSMEKAIKIAKKTAKRGDLVVLSPACASFGLFKNEFERAKKFIQALSKNARKTKKY